ncbi:MAG: hypothetical protein KKC37_07570, partial [Proteobacteria bacterium]|nr:hypothetical protein [Pseudomonadota bacterium]
STVHDIGYPAEIHSRNLTSCLKTGLPDIQLGLNFLIESLTNYDKPEKSSTKKTGRRINNHFDMIDSYFSAKKIVVGKKIKQIFNKKCREYGIVDHGIFGSIILTKFFERMFIPMLKTVLESEEIDEYLPEGMDREKLAYGFRDQLFGVFTAVCLHNIKLKVPLEMEQHPLAYLLILCDELQEWNRFSFGREILSDKQVDITYSSKTSQLIVKYALPKIICMEKEKRIKEKLVLREFDLVVKSYMEDS